MIIEKSKTLKVWFIFLEVYITEWRNNLSIEFLLNIVIVFVCSFLYLIMLLRSFPDGAKQVKGGEQTYI